MSSARVRYLPASFWLRRNMAANGDPCATPTPTECDSSSDLSEREHLLGQNVKMQRINGGATEADELVCPSERMCSLVNVSDNSETADDELIGNAEATLDLEDHCHQPDKPADVVARNQLIIVSVLCFVFMTAESVGGLLAHSLAVATDALHMASDLAGFLISLFAIWLSKRSATARMSFGFHRAEVIGALISILIIWVITAVLVFMAVHRIHDGHYEIESTSMLITSAVGVAFNVAMGLVLHCKGCRIQHGHSHGGGHGHSHNHSHSDNNHVTASDSRLLISDDSPSMPPHVIGNSCESLPRRDTDDDDQLLIATVTPVDHHRHGAPAMSSAHGHAHEHKVNINVRAAMIHVIGDLIQSIGVFIAAMIIYYKPDYKIADPICTFVFSFLVLCTTINVLRDIVVIMMEGVPRDIDYHTIKRDLSWLNGVESVHSLNVWALTMDRVVVAVHLAVSPGVRWSDVLASSTELLRRKYKVHHSTIQVEHYDADVMQLCHKCQSP